MKSFLTSYSQPSLLSRLPSRIENRCCHKPYYLLKTGFLSFPFFATCCLAATRCNGFTCKCSTSASTANSFSKGFEPTQNRIVGSKPLHQDTHTKPEGRPFYPNSLNRNNPKSITARNEFSVSGGRKRLSLGKKQHVPIKELPSARDPLHQDVYQTGKEEKKVNHKTLCTGLCNATLSNPESLPARLSKSFSFKQKRSAQKENQTVFVRSPLPEKFVNLLMANGEKDKARRCLTQALFSITTHCQKHNLQNNSPLEIFTDSFFKQESTESKPSSADNSLKRKDLGTVQQETGTKELLTPLLKGKSNTLLYPGSPTQSQIHNFKKSNWGSKQEANPRDVFNPLRDVGLVLVESRLDNLSNNRYSGTRKRELYPSLKEEKVNISIAKEDSISRLNHIERVEKRLVLKQNGSFFPFVKQKPPHFAFHQVVEIPLELRTDKQIGTLKVPLSLPFCGKGFETALNVFSSFALHKKQNNPFLSLIRLSLKERFLTSEKGFASLTLHKKVQQSYLCSALLHLVRTKCGTYTTTQTEQIHFKSSLPYSALFNWRGKRLNPLFGFAKQSQRFLMELCKFVPNRVVKGTKGIRQNNLFGFLPLLSPFYPACIPSSPFSFLPTPSITTKPLPYRINYAQAIPNVFGTVIGLQNQPVGSKVWLPNLHKLCLQSNKQVPQNDSHSNTKDKETPLCFIQGIPPVAKKVFERENHPYLGSRSKDIKSVHTEVLLKGIQRVQPTLEVRRVRKGRNTFQVPSVVKQKRGEKVSIKWIIDSAKSKKGKKNKLFSLSLANQLVQSFDRLGEARLKRNELLKLAESNRPFLRFRWW